MTLPRRALKTPEEVILLAAVNSRCPLCDTGLTYEKRGKSYKHYEIAHIYPLNPDSEEVALLGGEERLSGDPNHVDNLIPLCLSCHGKFDKPRTTEEYRQLVQAKKTTLTAAQRRELHYRYGILDDIKAVVDALDSLESPVGSPDLILDAKTLEQKFDSTLPITVRRKIRHNVNDYFFYVRQTLQRLDLSNPGTANIVLNQVRTFYLAQKRIGWNQHQIFESVTDWLVTKTRPKTFEAAEILASFFVQNCEVFE